MISRLMKIIVIRLNALNLSDADALLFSHMVLLIVMRFKKKINMHFGLATSNNA